MKQPKNLEEKNYDLPEKKSQIKKTHEIGNINKNKQYSDEMYPRNLNLLYNTNLQYQLKKMLHNQDMHRESFFRNLYPKNWPYQMETNASRRLKAHETSKT